MCVLCMCVCLCVMGRCMVLMLVKNCRCKRTVLHTNMDIEM